MQVQLKPGVRLTVVPVSQFKNTQISVHFLEKATQEQTSYRSLLANILETSSQKFPNQRLVSEELSNLYGAGFGTSIMRKQQIHDVTFSLAIANDHYLNTQGALLTQGLAFLKEMIFKPLLDQQQFDSATFKRQQANLVTYIQALADDKQTYAALKLQQLYFDQNEVQKIPAFGEADTIAQIKNRDLLAYYQQMLATDAVEIFVVGQVTLAEVQAQLSHWPLAARAIEKIDIKKVQHDQRVMRVQTETQPVVQAKLNLAYDFPTDFRNAAYYAGITFNALFGGSPLSKLFLNVREKASLAYYASSNIDVFNGLMVVQTGINTADKARVLKIIEQQLTDIERGEFTDENVAQIKAGLVSNYIASLDTERTYTARALTNNLVKSAVTADQWINAIQKVTREEIMAVAKKVRLQAVYFLSAEGEENA
ncbi:EF-P 5-aminopentanol modification-associated protein YfmF [Pediococcus siamensis]|uniref:EF-P 5-aminopentanol modification-associated protein YfmF n=1 Tax=Pediococcus siamensis TaxID=381829 RepID=UPI0039A0A439